MVDPLPDALANPQDAPTTRGNTALRWALAALAAAFLGVVVYLLTYLVVGYVLGAIGYALGWVVSGLVGFGSGPALVLAALFLLGLGFLVAYLRRTARISWKVGVWFTLLLLLAFGPIFIGYCCTTMPWEYGAQARKWMGTWSGFSAGAWLFFLIVSRFNFEEMDAQLAQLQPTPVVVDSRLERRLKRMALCFKLVASIPFGILGLIDEGWPGCLIGAGVGGAAGHLLGEWVAAMIRWIMADTDHESPIPLPGQSGPRPGRHPAWSMVGWIIGLPFLILVCHDGYWYFNWLSCVQSLALTEMVNTGARGPGREALQKNPLFHVQGWALQGTTARPLRWLLTEENQTLNSALLDMVDLIQGNSGQRVRFLEQHKVTRLGLQVLLEINDLALAAASKVGHETANVLRHVYAGKAWSYRFVNWLIDRRARLLRELQTTEKTAMETVLREDRALGRGGLPREQIIRGMKGLDLGKCPRAFQDAYRRHIAAWERNDAAGIRATFAEVKQAARDLGVDTGPFE